MQQRPHTLFFLIAALTTVLGLMADLLSGSLGTRLGFTGMYSAFAAVCCAVLLMAARSDSAHIRIGRLIVVAIGVLFSLNFMRLTVKWGHGQDGLEFRTVTAALLSLAWTFAIGVLVMAHIEPRRQKTTTPQPFYLRFGTVVSALVVVVVLVAVRGLHSPTASMAKDLLTGGSDTTAASAEPDPIPESAPRGARGASRNPVDTQSVPKYSIGPIA